MSVYLDHSTFSMKTGELYVQDTGTENRMLQIDPATGKTLGYVPVPGMGEEKDFEGLDLTGKVALIPARL